MCSFAENYLLAQLFPTVCKTFTEAYPEREVASNNSLRTGNKISGLKKFSSMACAHRSMKN